MARMSHRPMSMPLMTRVVMPRRPTSLGWPHLVPDALRIEGVLADDILLQVLEEASGHASRRIQGRRPAPFAL